MSQQKSIHWGSKEWSDMQQREGFNTCCKRPLRRVLRTWHVKMHDLWMMKCGSALSRVRLHETKMKQENRLGIKSRECLQESMHQNRFCKTRSGVFLEIWVHCTTSDRVCLQVDMNAFVSAFFFISAFAEWCHQSLSKKKMMTAAPTCVPAVPTGASCLARQSAMASKTAMKTNKVQIMPSAFLSS